MPKKQRWNILIGFLVLALIGQFASAAELKVIPKGKTNSPLYAVAFEDHNWVNKIRLGAAYLLRPEVANRADVVWAYSFNDNKVRQVIKQEQLEGPLYFKAHNRDKFTVLSEPASKLAIENAGSAEALWVKAKSRGIEVGVVLNEPASNGLEANRDLINWQGSSKSAVWLENEVMAQQAIFQLLETGYIDAADYEEIVPADHDAAINRPAPSPQQ